jgi:imidazolonepropionase-like amidohydrolase
MDSTTCLANVAVVDVARGITIPGRSVVLRDGKVDAILDRPPDAANFPGTVHDADGLFLCPGLIDCHVHFFLDAGPSPRTSFLESDDDTKMACARRNARIAIEAGITTMRDCGAPAVLMFEFQRQLRRGAFPGPHVLSCGCPQMRPKGHCHFMGGEEATADDVRRLIEWNLSQAPASSS